MENSTIDKRNHILDPNFETYHSQLQFKQLMALTICQNCKWNARVLRTERTGSGQTGPAHEVGPLSTFGHAQNARSARPDI